MPAQTSGTNSEKPNEISKGFWAKLHRKSEAVLKRLILCNWLLERISGADGEDKFMGKFDIYQYVNVII